MCSLKRWVLFIVVVMGHINLCAHHEPIRAVVLAAGKSSRFKATTSKIIYPVYGVPMILYPLRALAQLSIPMTLVLGHQADCVRNVVESAAVPAISYVIQEKQCGTGHAVICAQETLGRAKNILIINGDMPLTTKDLLESVIKKHTQDHAIVTFVVSQVNDPTGYGRVIERDGKYAIVEQKDCTEQERLIKTINAGIYLIDQAWLSSHLKLIKPSFVTNELYLVDLIRLASDEGEKVSLASVPFDQVRGINTLEELYLVENSMKNR